MKKKIMRTAVVFTFLLMILGISGCQKKVNVEDCPYKIYYVNSQVTSLTAAPYEGEMNDTEAAVDEMLKALKEQNDIEMLPAIPEKVEVISYTIEQQKMTIHFNDAYKEMDVVREVMCRAAVVCSLTQIPGIDEIMFYIEEEPLANEEGITYGYMQADGFVQNTGSSINSYEMTDFVLYFSNAEGDALIEEAVNVRCNSSQARESAAIEYLMKGPETSGLLSTIPKGTKLLNASINNGICYLNFNEGLNNSIPGVKPETTIYSIVNTVIECGNVGLVKIAINGESNLMFQECVKLDEPLSRNLDIVEEMPVESKEDDVDVFSVDRNYSIIASGVD